MTQTATQSTQLREEIAALSNRNAALHQKMLSADAELRGAKNNLVEDAGAGTERISAAKSTVLAMQDATAELREKIGALQAELAVVELNEKRAEIIENLVLLARSGEEAAAEFSRAQDALARELERLTPVVTKPFLVLRECRAAFVQQAAELAPIITADRAAEDRRPDSAGKEQRQEELNELLRDLKSRGVKLDAIIVPRGDATRSYLDKPQFAPESPTCYERAVNVAFNGTLER